MHVKLSWNSLLNYRAIQVNTVLLCILFAIILHVIHCGNIQENVFSLYLKHKYHMDGTVLFNTQKRALPLTVLMLDKPCFPTIFNSISIRPMQTLLQSVVKASMLPASFEELKINCGPEQDIFSTFLHEMMSNTRVSRVTDLLLLLFFLLDFCHALYCGNEISAGCERI